MPVEPKEGRQSNIGVVGKRDTKQIQKMAGCYLLSLVFSPTPVNTVYPSYKVAI